MRINQWLGVAAGVSMSAAVFGGQITFKNGDHLTGTVTATDENKLTIDSKVAGKITVPLSDVASFTTDAPVKATLSSGDVVKAPLTTMETPATTPADMQSIPREKIAKLEPATLAAPWTGSVLVGATVQTGNTRTAQVNASANAVRRWENSRLTLEGQYIYGRAHDRNTDQDTTTSDYAEASAKYDYFLSKKFYLYGLMQAQHDEVADLVIRLTPSAGVGYQWHESPKWNFSTEAGLGWTYEDYSPGGVDEYVAGRLAYHFDHKLGKNMAFIHNVEYLPDLEDPGQFVLNADAGVHADISKTMFTEFKVQLTHNSAPPPSAEKNDVRYLASFGWHF
ncbi:MAG TPA: DUF481 domain-containing protein [Tepidisphaeraceae bacterium]|jgi:putative salt-induced outer membrane protein YdiY